MNVLENTMSYQTPKQYRASRKAYHNRRMKELGMTPDQYRAQYMDETFAMCDAIQQHCKNLKKAKSPTHVYWCNR